MEIMTFGMVIVAKQSRIIENGTHTHECHRFEKRSFACASLGLCYLVENEALAKSEVMYSDVVVTIRSSISLEEGLSAMKIKRRLKKVLNVANWVSLYTKSR